MERANSILTDPVYREHLAKIAARESGRQFCRHDLTHCLDVARVAYIRWLEQGCPDGEVINKEIIYTAALLHDIGRWREYDCGEDHAAAGSEMVGDILRAHGFLKQEIQIIRTAIASHRKEGAGKDTLGTLLYQGDKLSRCCLCCTVQDQCRKYPSLPGLRLY